MKRTRNKQQGFSLLELLIVVAIILIIAAIAIPRFLQARAGATEGAAAGTTRGMSTALASYNSRYGVFPATASMLGGVCTPAVPATPALACLLDNTIATNIGVAPIGSYNYVYNVTNAGAGFTMVVDPAAGTNATRHFYIDDGLTIHRNDTAAAGPTDPTL